ncbi:MAG: hypothetical protein KJZ87_05035 [Thermoguttaceae bacterium]|nr:hypothetical protein [Thermoguttaceae bacterium]
MSQELLYTSAPRGLKPGSRGFCTVMSTQGMPLNLAERLESLSGYRHVFTPPDRNAAYNPVVHSHFRITIGGQQFFILSRIADAGLDYSQRTNKIAHHVALLPHELPAGGPAWLMTQPGFMERSWQGEPRLLPAGRPVPKGNTGPAACRAWQAIAGDAGWGGVLAEGALTDPRRTIYLIFRPGTDVLALIAESLALVPPENRWNVSFSTYCAAIPPGVECQWRGVVEGSPEAKAARQAAAAMVLDLTGPLGPPPASPFVEAARSGRSVATPRPAPIPPQAARSQAAPIPADNAAATQTVPPDLAPPSIYDLVSPPPAEARPPRMRLHGGAGRGVLDERAPRRWPAWAIVAAAITLLILLAGAFGAGVLVGRGWVELAARDATSHEHSLPTNPHQPSTQADAQSAKRIGIETTPSSDDETSGAAARSPEQPKEAPGDQSGGDAPQAATSPSPTATGGEDRQSQKTVRAVSPEPTPGTPPIAQSSPAVEPEGRSETPAQLDSGAAPSNETSGEAAIAPGRADQNSTAPPATNRSAPADDDGSSRVETQSRRTRPVFMNLPPRGNQGVSKSSPDLPVIEITDLVLVGVPLDEKGTQFQLNKIEGAETYWQCVYPQASGDPIPVGRFRLVNARLVFEWDEHTEQPQAVQLANSIVLIRSGKSWLPAVQLREPLVGRKLTLSATSLRRQSIELSLKEVEGSWPLPPSFESTARLKLDPDRETGANATGGAREAGNKQYADLARITMPVEAAQLECAFLLDVKDGNLLLHKQHHRLTGLPARINSAMGTLNTEWQDIFDEDLNVEIDARKKLIAPIQKQLEGLRRNPKGNEAPKSTPQVNKLFAEKDRLQKEIDLLTSIKPAFNKLNCTIDWEIGFEVEAKHFEIGSKKCWLCIARSEETSPK